MSGSFGNKNGKGRVKVSGVLDVPSQAMNVIRAYRGRDGRIGRSGEVIRANGIGEFIVIGWKDKFDLLGSKEFEVALASDVWKDKSGRYHVREGGIVYVLNSFQYWNLKNGEESPRYERSERTSRVVEYSA